MGSDKIYAQVLLLDNKIEAWKICQDKKDHPYDFKAYWKMDRFNDYTMETFTFSEGVTPVEDGWNFNMYVYEVLAPRWINKWEYAEDYRGSKAKESSLEEVNDFHESISKAFGGRFTFVGTLGKN